MQDESRNTVIFLVCAVALFIVVSALMGGVSGSAVADAAMEARILGPAMLRNGFSRGFSSAFHQTHSGRSTLTRMNPSPSANSFSTASPLTRNWMRW